MNLKSNKAITLVALIITIIVLLILAGVTLNMVLGENGLINKAQSSVDKYQQSSINEQKLLNSIEEYFDSNVQRDKELTLSETSGTCLYPNTLSFTVTNNPSGGTITAISSETSIATVSVNGNTITVTPKNVNGTATITVKSAATGNYEEKNAMYTVTVNKNPSAVTSTEIEASPTTYYGKKVTNYTAGGATWRIFYVDSTGKYGERDTIYLKADIGASSGVSYATQYSNTDVLRKMNSLWWSQRGGEEDKWTAKEKQAAWFCDPDNWISYCDVDLANYAIGSPSVEMYIDSFNKTHGKDSLTCKYATGTSDAAGKKNEHGYCVGVSGVYENSGEVNEGLYTVSNSINTQPSCNDIYYSASESWFLSSPSSWIFPAAGSDHSMLYVNSGSGGLGTTQPLYVYGPIEYGCVMGNAYRSCPVVSLKSKVVCVE